MKGVCMTQIRGSSYALQKMDSSFEATEWRHVFLVTVATEQKTILLFFQRANVQLAKDVATSDQHFECCFVSGQVRGLLGRRVPIVEAKLNLYGRPEMSTSCIADSCKCASYSGRYQPATYPQVRTDWRPWEE